MAESSSYLPILAHSANVSVDEEDMVTKKSSNARELDDMSLLRGVPAHKLFACFGQLLSAPSPDSQYSSDTSEAESWYAASKIVPTLSSFISHSWRDSRWLKYVTLLWISNSGIAFACANCVALLWAIAEAVGLPCPTATMVYSTGVINVLGLSGPVYAIVFLLVLMNGHKIKGCHIEDTCFLDKCCICQTDPVLKTRGITSLGGFLTFSDRMAVMYTSDYVSRLWCIYELACFCSTKSPREVDFMPIKAPALTLALLAMKVLYICTCFAGAALSEEDGGWLGETATGLGLIGLCCFLAYNFEVAQLLRSRAELQVGLETFSFDKARCFCCDVGHVLDGGKTISCDREFVAANVEEWFASKYDCERKEGIARFEEYVRTDLSKHTRAIQGPPIMPLSWQTFFITGMAVVWFGVDIAILSPDVRIRLGNAIEMAVWPFWSMICGAFTGIAVKYSPRCSGWVAVMMDGAIAFTALMFMLGFWGVWDTLVQDVNTPLYLLALVFVSVVSLAYLLHAQTLL